MLISNNDIPDYKVKITSQGIVKFEGFIDLNSSTGQKSLNDIIMSAQQDLGRLDKYQTAKFYR